MHLFVVNRMKFFFEMGNRMKFIIQLLHIMINFMYHYKKY